MRIPAKSALLFFILIFCLQELFPQKYLLGTDTVRIDDIEVVSRRVKGESGYKMTQINSDKLKLYYGASLSDLLEKNSSLSIKNYGTGGLATSSFRGMGANHTRVFWEGIPVNSPTTGQVDFSLLPVSFASRVIIYHGAAPTNSGSGGPGGSVVLSSMPDWKNGSLINFVQQIGSFGLVTNNLSLVTGNSKWQMVTNAFTRVAQNNFPYPDRVSGPETVIMNRRHNSFFMKGLNNELFLKKGKNIISAKVWYNTADRELPGPIVSGLNSEENQYDEQFRAAIILKNYSMPVVTGFKAAFTNDYIFYSNPIAGIESATTGRSLFFSSSAEKNIGVSSKIRVEISDRYGSVNSLNHDGYRSQNNLVTRAEYSFSRGESIAILLLGEINSAGTRIYSPLPSIGVDLRLGSGGRLFLKANAGKSMTIPTLNDLYWVPGGNPDLENETGYNSEISLEFRDKKKYGITATGDFTLYYSGLKNMIKWLPGEYSIWSPRNIAEVRSFGSEIDASLSYNGNIGLFTSQLSYSYNRVMNMERSALDDASAGKQLIYVPMHQAYIKLEYSGKIFGAGWFTDYTGLRYTATDNSQYLSAYLVSDLEFSCQLRIKGNYFRTSFVVQNIFNSYYEQVAYYPLPGRNYRLSVTYNLNRRS